MQHTYQRLWWLWTFPFGVAVWLEILVKSWRWWERRDGCACGSCHSVEIAYFLFRGCASGKFGRPGASSFCSGERTGLQAKRLRWESQRRACANQTPAVSAASKQDQFAQNQRRIMCKLPARKEGDQQKQQPMDIMATFLFSSAGMHGLPSQSQSVQPKRAWVTSREMEGGKEGK